jgi:response regulator RpfG family c-di-GMP phosphodiesterase
VSLKLHDVQIYLPLIEPLPKGGKEQPIAEAPKRGTETILIAEDDEKVRNLFLTGLTNFGYTVIEATDGEDAVHKYRDHKDRIDLLILTLMPEKWNEVNDEVKITPDIKILLVPDIT